MLIARFGSHFHIHVNFSKVCYKLLRQTFEFIQRSSIFGTYQTHKQKIIFAAKDAKSAKRAK